MSTWLEAHTLAPRHSPCFSRTMTPPGCPGTANRVSANSLRRWRSRCSAPSTPFMRSRCTPLLYTHTLFFSATVQLPGKPDRKLFPIDRTCPSLKGVVCRKGGRRSQRLPDAPGRVRTGCVLWCLRSPVSRPALRARTLPAGSQRGCRWRGWAWCRTASMWPMPSRLPTCRREDRSSSFLARRPPSCELPARVLPTLCSKPPSCPPARALRPLRPGGVPCD